MKGTTYIAGPMTGHPDFNYGAFYEAEDSLIQEGHEVFNPASFGREPKLSHADYMRLSFVKLLECQSVVALRGWEKSRGARTEITVALSLGMTVYTYPGRRQIKWKEIEGAEDALEVPMTPKTRVEAEMPPAVAPASVESICAEAARLVDGARQGDYGHPADDFTRTGKIWGAILGTEPVSPEKVGLCMIGVKISRECNQHKRDNLVDGAGYFQTVDLVISKRDQS
jgi:hypothetical protein